MKNKLLLFILLSFYVHLSAQMGSLGAGNIASLNTIVNTYTYLTSNAIAGATSLTVNSNTMSGGAFSSNLTTGDMIMIIQMQGATINTTNNSSYGSITSYNSAGLHETRCVASVSGSNIINLAIPLTNNYTASGKVQIIRVPRYTDLRIRSSSSIIAPAWNGRVGGVVALEIQGQLRMDHASTSQINVDQLGFRGGIQDNYTQGAANPITTLFRSTDSLDGGEKGESIAGFTTDYDALNGRYGRGAPANGGGGGNTHNAGGGGGANAGSISAWNGQGNPVASPSSWATAWNLEGGSFSTNTSSGGGRGGYTFGSSDQNATSVPPGDAAWGGNRRQNVGGYGGRPLDYSGGRIFMGGGGGAGDGNNSAANGGAAGGGLIYILHYGTFHSNNGMLTANGGNGGNTLPNHNDAPGGGGGGGSIIFASAANINNGYTLRANGGNGGNQLITNNESEGPGGGGGGGYIAISGGSPTRTANGGSNGTTSSAALTEFIANGATSGGAGVINATISLHNLIGSTVSQAGSDDVYCGPIMLSAEPLGPNSIGTWQIISGVGGSIDNVNNPTALFTGDSSSSYVLVWRVTNNLCQVSTDTVRIVPNCIALPIRLISFEGINYQFENKMNWKVASEENVFYYAIMRSYDEVNFHEIGRVDAKNQYDMLVDYHFVDQFPGNRKTVFYKLKIVDLDGSYNYSPVIQIEKLVNGNEIKGVFPNPTNMNLTIETQQKMSAYSQIYLTDIQGKIIYQIAIKELDENSTVVNLSELRNGLYFLNVIKKNGEKYLTRLTKN
ncbi:MAG: T9SS type A sorting domain-containing protein [Bacteroidota bacterium]|nr:T9SS type A sorting domain-containing protein [Bacteroidota bacterium]